MSLEYQLMRAAALGFSLPPLGMTQALGSSLGGLGMRLDQRHRRIVLDNLAASFPEKGHAWVQKTARDCFGHLGKVVMEIPRLVRLGPGQLLDLTRFHNTDRVMWLRKKGRGFFVLNGHLGNWEWGGAATGAGLFPMMVVARPLDSAPADRLVNGWRTKTGNQVVPKAHSARKLLRHIRQGGAAGILLDQNVDWYDGEWVDFFGRPACSNKGLALLAMATGAPVIPLYCFRADDGGFDIHFGEEIPLVKTGDKLMDVWNNTQNYTKALEDIIRQKPAQWFWMHQRWKTKPYKKWPREGR